MSAGAQNSTLQRRVFKPSDNDNNSIIRPPDGKPKSREVLSRYLSTSTPKRCASPLIERRRPSMPRANESGKAKLVVVPSVSDKRVAMTPVSSRGGGGMRFGQGGGCMSRSVDFSDGKKRIGSVGGSRNAVWNLRSSMVDETPRIELNNAERNMGIKCVVEGNICASVRKSTPQRRVTSPMPVMDQHRVGGFMNQSWDFTDKRKGIGDRVGSRNVIRASQSSAVDGRGTNKEVDDGFLGKNDLHANVTMRKSTPNRRRVTRPISAPVGNVVDKQPWPGRLRRGEGFMNWSVDSVNEKNRIGGSKYVVSVLQVLHNRHMQWHFVNAWADAGLSSQTVNAERRLYSTWVGNSKLHYSVKAKRTELQMLKQHLKLTSIIKEQILYLEEWALMDGDVSSSLLGATEALMASTLRLPVVSGARVDVPRVKWAVSSAVDVMQAMVSSIVSLTLKVDNANHLVALLAEVVAREHAFLNQYKDLLSTAIAFHVKECSLRTHILQEQRVPSGFALLRCRT